MKPAALAGLYREGLVNRVIHCGIKLSVQFSYYMLTRGMIHTKVGA